MPIRVEARRSLAHGPSEVEPTPEATSMSYYERVRDLDSAPEELERVYQTAFQAGEAEDFKRAIETSCL